MAAITICSDFGAQNNKVCHCFHCFSIYCREGMGPDVMILVFWMLSFKPAWVLDHKEDWVPKNWCFQIVVQEESWESLDCKEIKPVNPKGNQPWMFTRRTEAEAEVPILWPPDVKSQLIGKDPDVGKVWRQKEKGAQRVRWLDNITDSMDTNLSKAWETVEGRGALQATVHGVTKSRRWLSNWRTAIFLHHFIHSS